MDSVKIQPSHSWERTPQTDRQMFAEKHELEFPSRPTANDNPRLEMAQVPINRKTGQYIEVDSRVGMSDRRENRVHFRTMRGMNLKAGLSEGGQTLEEQHGPWPG